MHLSNPVALKETCRVARGRVPLWAYHRARLERGGVSAELLDQAEDRITEAALPWADSATQRARLTLVVEPNGTLTIDVARRLSSLDVPNGPVVARVDVDELPPFRLLPAKPADRLWWDAAHKQAQRCGAHQAVLVGPDGFIIDGSTAAVWIREGTALFTPPSPPAVSSVSVDFVRAQAERADLDIRVEPIDWPRFQAAEEAFLTNAYGGAVPVRGRSGWMHKRIAELFAVAWMPVWRG